MVILYRGTECAKYMFKYYNLFHQRSPRYENNVLVVISYDLSIFRKCAASYQSFVIILVINIASAPTLGCILHSRTAFCIRLSGKGERFLTGFRCSITIYRAVLKFCYL